MSVSPAVAPYLESFRERHPALPGGNLPWLRQIREAAIAQFRNRGFPGPRDEDWKYTRTAPLERQPFRAATGDPEDAADADVARCAGRVPAGCCRLVFVDGRLSRAHSAFEDPGDGVVVTAMRDALAHPPEALRRHFGRYAGREGFPFAALNTAFADDGAFIHLQRRASTPHPVHLLFLSTGREPDVVSHPRVLVIAEVASRALVVEHHAAVGAGSRCFNNAVSEVVLESGACVEHYKAQLEGESTYHIASIEVQQAENSHFTSHLTSLGGRLVRHDINVRMAAPHARCDLQGLYLASGRQHMDFHTRIDHLKPGCTSNEVYKGVLDGRARGVFNGRVLVHPDAQKSDAHQANDNLLLSPHVEIDTKPQLEIHADDVKCSHGATVGQLDESMLFYLRARGIEERSARALLTFGFLEQMLETVPIPWLRESLKHGIAGRLPGAADLPGLGDREGDTS